MSDEKGDAGRAMVSRETAGKKERRREEGGADKPMKSLTRRSQCRGISMEKGIF